MSYGHLLAHVLRELEKVATDYMRKEHIEKLVIQSWYALLQVLGQDGLGAGALIATTAWGASMHIRTE